MPPTDTDGGRSSPIDAVVQRGNAGDGLAETGLGVSLWRLIARIGIGVELVTIDTYISELVPKSMRGRAFAFNQAVQFMIVPVVAFIAYMLVPSVRWGLTAGDGWS